MQKAAPRPIMVVISMLLQQGRVCRVPPSYEAPFSLQIYNDIVTKCWNARDTSRLNRRHEWTLAFGHHRLFRTLCRGLFCVETIRRAAHGSQYPWKDDRPGAGD